MSYFEGSQYSRLSVNLPFATAHDFRLHGMSYLTFLDEFHMPFSSQTPIIFSMSSRPVFVRGTVVLMQPNRFCKKLVVNTENILRARTASLDALP